MNTYTKDNTLVNGPSPVKVVTSNSVAYNEEKEPSFLALVGGLAEKTGMHGLPNVQRSNSLFRKIFWLLITIAGLCILHIYFFSFSIFSLLIIPSAQHFLFGKLS